METGTSISSMHGEKPYMSVYLPKPPTRIVAYTEQTLKAPQSALRGVVVDAREPVEPKSRRKIRMYSVGSTNRWRSPMSLGGDLLGSSQAIKAISATKNSTVFRAKTADTPQLSVAKESDLLGSAWGRSPLPSRPFTSPSRAEMSHDRRFPPLTSERPPSPPKTGMSLQVRTPYASSAKTSRTRFKNPIKVLEMFARLANQDREPDVRLHCLDQVWQLHRPYMVKSTVLEKLLSSVNSQKKQRVYKDETSQKVDSFISDSEIYSSEYKEVTRRLTSKDVEEIRMKTKSRGTVTHPVVDVVLQISDPWVTRHALAIGLGHLYLDETIIATGDAVETLATACNLDFRTLISACCDVMITNLASDTVCVYLEAAVRYEQPTIISACERWLELNLVAQLSSTIYLRDVPAHTLDKILKSSRLFTYNEYSLYKTLCYWLFMQMHPNIMFMPAQTSVMTYFSSMTRSSAFLEREEGIKYSTAFGCLRLHGITDTKHLQDVMFMNIVSQSWLLRVFSHHYHALQGGGDMSFLLNFSLGASRFGFILEQEPGYHSEIISLHGFHFEAKTQRQGNTNNYIVYLQRLRPTDPSLSFRACERATFSMRRDRLVRYNLTVQHLTSDSTWRNVTSGVIEQRFGLDQKSAKSQVLRVTDVITPIYVSFAIFFPPS
nr:BTB/POZ domain-containing protein 16 [Ciona intestinalis]|eukprot:XP_009860570.2 BTB/POZ domain-containing protein 16 [Ciona intestinalis]